MRGYISTPPYVCMAWCFVKYHGQLYFIQMNTEDILVFKIVKNRKAGLLGCPWWWRQLAPLKRRSIRTRLHGATSQKTAIFILAALRISNINKFRIYVRLKMEYILIFFNFWKGCLVTATLFMSFMVLGRVNSGIIGSNRGAQLFFSLRFWGFHSSENMNCGILYSDAVQSTDGPNEHW
jgi:hypothetical protein